jgi:hypothetical protein
MVVLRYAKWFVIGAVLGSSHPPYGTPSIRALNPEVKDILCPEGYATKT